MLRGVGHLTIENCAVFWVFGSSYRCGRSCLKFSIKTVDKPRSTVIGTSTSRFMSDLRCSSATYPPSLEITSSQYVARAERRQARASKATGAPLKGRILVSASSWKTEETYFCLFQREKFVGCLTVFHCRDLNANKMPAVSVCFSL
jgi:hypothetical protein